MLSKMKQDAHNRFLLLQSRVVGKGGFRRVSEAVAYRFCRRFPARVVENGHLGQASLILDYHDPYGGNWQQPIAFVDKEKR